MEPLIISGKRHFVNRNRNGKKALQMLADLGINSFDEAWNLVLQLDQTHYWSGPEPDDKDPTGPLVIWVFKVEIDGIITYIKLKDETHNRGCVCLSFHEDEP